MRLDEFQTAIKDAVRLGVLEAMEEHREKEHRPLDKRVSAVENKLWMTLGISSGISWSWDF